MKLRIATFNVENLFSRFDFAGRVARAQQLVGVYQFDDPAQYRLARMVFSAVHADDMRQLTALAIADTNADIVCLQEVDNEQALSIFYENYLRPILRPLFARATRGLDDSQKARVSSRFFYDWRHLLPGNDSRGIDVAVLSRYEIGLRSHAGVAFDFLDDATLDRTRLEALGERRDSRIFRRDCLEVDFEQDGKRLTLFVCHFKSRQGGRRADPAENAADTLAVRRAEALAVRRIIERRFGAQLNHANWAICGDFNDYRDVDGEASGAHALDVFLADGFAIDPSLALPAHERWTHYRPASDEHLQLDYILLSPALARANPGARPEIGRLGQPWRVPRLIDAPRYPRVGWDRPKASDHCPVTIELTLPG